MYELHPLESLAPLKGLETKLTPLFEKDTKKYYSNLDLVCMSTDLLYKAHLLLEQIQQKRNEETLTIDEYLKLNNKSKKLIKEAIIYSSTYEKDSIYWNDEDIENEFTKGMLGNVEEC